MVARNEEKMKERLKEFSCQTMYVVADFAKLNTIDDYRTKVADKLKGIDIGILILNAGMANMAPFTQEDDQKVQDMVNVNALQVIYMAKTVTPMMTQRAKRSGMVITSSGLGSIPVSGTITYSAAKSFASFIGRGLNYELQDKIDVLVYQAGMV